MKKFFLPPNTPNGQRDAVTADEKIITVEAAAGTGKTWVLSNRYIRLLLENKEIKPANILTLTYTEAAASEMKTRIVKRIEEELKNFDDIERKNEILDGLADSWISTIHSFAGRIIRESGLSLDIDPTATVISPQQEQEFWEGIKNAVEFANLRELARTYGNKELRDAAKFLDENDYMAAAVNKWRSEKLSVFAQKTADLHASSGHSWEEMLAWSENYTLIETTWPIVKNILENEWYEVWKIFARLPLPKARKTNKSGTVLTELLEWQKSTSPSFKALKYFYERLISNINKDIVGNSGEPFSTLTGLLGMTITEFRKTRPALVKEITADFEKEILPEELEMKKILMKFCAVSWGMWDMMKKRRGLLSFSDMILHARRAINNKSVNRNFNHILVDEFQDTDPLQFDMIKELAKNSDTNLFAVGDPKQSIYKFRYADPSLFAKTINNSDKRVNLDVSFRTRKTLLDRINLIFSSLWLEGLGKSEAMRELKYEKVNAAANEAERNSGTMPDFKIILSRYETTLEDTRKKLSEELASNISKWVSEGKTIWDKAAKKIRPVKFSDFAVLSRSRWIYSAIEDAFEKFNIPSIRDKSEDFFTRGEIGDIVCMLRAAANINDNFSVAGWLMSPFSELNEDDVIKILTLAGKEENISEIIKNNLPQAYSRLEYLSLIGENEGPAGILEIFDKDRKWLSCYQEKDRIRVLRNFRHALAMSANFQQSGTSSLTACAEWLTRSVKSKLKIEEPKWHDENENAVKLGTVHSSKGLEYPVTVVFEDRKQKKADINSLRPSRELGLVFVNFPDELEMKDENGRELEPKLKKWERLIANQGDLEEETRLFYVAATRAQDSLIFCGLVGEDDRPYKNTWTEFLIDNLGEIAENEFSFAKGIDEAEIKNEKIKEEEISLTSVNLIKPKNFLRQISASSFSLFEWCPFAWRRRYRQGQILTWEFTEKDFEPDEFFTGGAALGSLAHWILARWPKNENFISELEYYLYGHEILPKLPANLRDIWRDRQAKISLKKWLLNFASSGLGVTLRNEKDIKREYRFMLRINKETSLAGAMDALYKNNLIDYKITSVENVPLGLYDPQLDFYSFVAHELTGQDSIKTITYFLREGVSSERECKNFDDIKTRILKAAEICASGPFEPKLEHCASCPFKKGCVFSERNFQDRTA